jgi:hypothetical protein
MLRSAIEGIKQGITNAFSRLMFIAVMGLSVAVYQEYKRYLELRKLVEVRKEMEEEYRRFRADVEMRLKKLEDERD